jgi:hypothetical protein
MLWKLIKIRAVLFDYILKYVDSKNIAYNNN